MKTNQGTIAAPRPGYGPLPTPRANRRRAHISTARAGLLGILIDQPGPCTVSVLSDLTRQHANTIREHLDGLVDERLAVRTRAPARGRGRPAWLYSAAPEIGSEPGGKEYAGLASALAAHIARTSQQPREDAIEAGVIWGREIVRRSFTAEVDPAGDVAAAVAESRQVAATTGGSTTGGSTWDGSTTGGSTWDGSTTGGSTWDGSTTGGSTWDGSTTGGGNLAGGGDTPASVAARAPSALATRREVVDIQEELGFAPRADAQVGVVKLHRCPLLEAAHQHPDVVCGVHLGVVRGTLEALGADPERTERTVLQPFSEPGACRLDLLPRRVTS